MKIIDKRLIEASELINKHIERISSSNRADESVEILSHLRDFCEAVFYKIYDEEKKFDLYQTQENLQQYVRPFIKSNYPKLNRFHQLLDCRGHILFGMEQSEALMIKYVPYLIDIKVFLKKEYNIDVLNSIEKYPLNLDDSLVKFYRKILYAMNLIKEDDSSKTNGLYFIRKKTMKYIDNQVFYEYVLDISDDKPNKFNTVVAYSKLNIDYNYDMTFKISRRKVNFLDINITIIIIKDFDICIRPCSFNTIVNMLQFDLNIKSRTKPYLELMNAIKTRHCSLLDLIEDSNFHLTNNDVYNSFIENVRNFIDTKQFGTKLIKYLLLNMRYNIVKGQVNHHLYTNTYLNPYFCNLMIASGSLGFEYNPIALSPLVESPSIEDLSRIIDFEQYEHEFLYREIKNYINANNSLFVDSKDILCFKGDIEELVERFNNSLYSYYSNYKIIKIYDKYTIKFYYEASINIIKNVSILTKKLNIPINYIRNENTDLSRDKINILESAFKNSSICFVTGAAGTGKTRLIHEYIKNNLDKSILCLTTTNTAKNNLKNNYSNNVVYQNTAEYKYRNGIYDFIIVDEASFVSTETMNKVFTDNMNANFLIVGDPYQIESIEFGNWFKLLLSIFKDCNFIYSLDSDHRAKTKELQKVWNAVRNISAEDNKILELMSAFEFASTITRSSFSISGHQVMLCLNYDGLYGINNLNRYMQSTNPNREFIYQQNIYKIGDPVVFVINDFEQYGLYNNIDGKIINIISTESYIEFYIDIRKKISNTNKIILNSQIQIDNSKETSIVIVRQQSTSIDDYDSELVYRSKLPFQLAYAMSIHKAQGLEFDKVKIIITSDTEEYISKNIFYTAITRAKRILEIYWDPEVPNKIFSNMIEESKSTDRDLSVFKRLIGEGKLII